MRNYRKLIRRGVVVNMAGATELFPIRPIIGPDLFTGFGTVPVPWLATGGSGYSIDGTQIATVALAVDGIAYTAGQVYRITVVVGSVVGVSRVILSPGVVIQPLVAGVNGVDVVASPTAALIIEADAGTVLAITSITVQLVTP
jgi:hypothetical protein